MTLNIYFPWIRMQSKKKWFESFVFLKYQKNKFISHFWHGKDRFIISER